MNDRFVVVSACEVWSLQLSLFLPNLGMKLKTNTLLVRLGPQKQWDLEQLSSFLGVSAHKL